MCLSDLVADDFIDPIGGQGQLFEKSVPSPLAQLHAVLHDCNSISLHVRDMIFRVVRIDPPATKSVVLGFSQVDAAK